MKISKKDQLKLKILLFKRSIYFKLIAILNKREHDCKNEYRKILEKYKY